MTYHENLEKLALIRGLPEEWCEDLSGKISLKVIGEAEEIIIHFGTELQPFIAPLSGRGVQLEWEQGERYVELSLYEDKWELWGSLPAFGEERVEIKRDVGALVDYIRGVFLGDFSALVL